MTEYSKIADMFDDIIANEDLARLKEFTAEEGGVEYIDAPLVQMAVNRKKPEMLEWILSQGFDPNRTDPSEPAFEQTPLFWATFSKHREMMTILVRYGAKVTAEIGADETSLHIAASDGDVESLVLLLEHASGRDALEVVDYVQRTPLQCAMESLNMSAVRVLLEAGANGDALENPIDGPSFLAALHRDELETPASLRLPCRPLTGEGSPS